MTNSEWGYLLVVVGNVLDLIGTFLILNLISGGFKEVRKYAIIRRNRDGAGQVAQNLRSDFDDLVKELNGVFNDINETNKKNHEKGKRYFWLIIVGFAFQMFAVFVFVASPHINHSNYSANNSSTDSCSKAKYPK